MSFLDNIYWKSLSINQDERGHLIECWRSDEYLFRPAMSYISWTLPGKKRGPHEHINQTDMFIFPGPGLFEVYLWKKPEEKRIFRFGADQPGLIVIPPGIVHAYKNVSKIPGLVINTPDALYCGYEKQEGEDIVKWEKEPDNPYIF